MAASAVARSNLDEVATRLPAAFASLLFVGAFYLFLSRRVSRTRAVGASLILMTTPEWFRASVSARVDMVLSVACAGAVLSVVRWQERGRTGMPWVLLLCVTVAALTKGPIGIVLPGLIAGIYILLREPLSFHSIKRLIVDGLKVAIPAFAIVSMWYLAAYWQRGDSFFAKAWYENVQRFAGTMEDEPHKHTWMYLWLMTFVGLLPWSTIAIGYLGLRRGKREQVATLEHRPNLFGRVRSADALTVVSWIVVVVTLAFFSIPTSKRSVYILPAYPFFAYLIALILEPVEYVSSRWLRWYERACAVITAIISGALIGVVLLSTLKISSALNELGTSVFRVFTLQRIALLVSVAAMFIVSFRFRFREITESIVLRVAVTLLVVGVFCELGIFGPISYNQTPKYWLQAPTTLEQLGSVDSATYFSFGSEHYAASFYLNKPFRQIVDQVSPGQLIFVEARKLPDLEKIAQKPLDQLLHFSPPLLAVEHSVVVVRVPVEVGTPETQPQPVVIPATPDQAIPMPLPSPSPIPQVQPSPTQQGTVPSEQVPSAATTEQKN